MAYSRENKEMKVLRKAETSERTSATAHQKEVLGILASCCLGLGVGLYVGTLTSAGGFKLRLYGPGANAETYVGKGDNMVDLIDEIAEAIGLAVLAMNVRADAKRLSVSPPPRGTSPGRAVETLPKIGGED